MMSAGFSDMSLLNVGILFLRDWKLITRFGTSDCFQPCGASRFLGVGCMFWLAIGPKGGKSMLNLLGELWSKELLKKEELKFVQKAISLRDRLVNHREIFF